MTCKLSDEDLAALETRWFWLGESEATAVHCAGGSLGSAREAAIAAFTKGYDEHAATLMRSAGLETLAAIDGELLGDAGE